MTAIKKITETSLQALSTSAITEMYNEIAGRIGMNVVKRFSDKSTAIKRALAAATAEAEAVKAEAKRVKAEAKANGVAVVKEPKAPRVQTIRNKGPRGFRVDSPVWMKSVLECKGIAALPANFPKLKDTATVYGVDAEKIESMTQAELIVATSAAVQAAPTPVTEELPKVVHEGFKETPAAE
jgi:hypothetical protein